MAGDYTRVRFNPFHDFLGVLMQQGRVMLDADFNELVEILDRRWRAETVDIIGRCTVPRQTPEGFRIQIGGASITIGRGRLYADGLLAENHGDAPLEFNATLAEQQGTLPIPYESQPYLPDAATAAPFPAEGGPHLVYADVWQREVTHVEDPDLVEQAVAVDTTTRLQTVWQVKVLPNVPPNTTCATPDDAIPGWPAIIAPSAGRLTTSPVGVPVDTDPCVVSPAGGFRGTENRLYRVEVHQPGPLGTATFKWSRDNSSIATRVSGISGTLDVLTVSRIGRDPVTSLRPGDWVEITDDHHEFYGLPGVMRKIQSVDEAAPSITLTAALPAGQFNTADPSSRDTRIRRWDQKGQVLNAANVVVADVDVSGGVIPIPAAGSMVLEDGVEVTFSAAIAGGEFHVGDYWVFAARTADASIEILQQAPPRGIHHHFCRLAIVTFPNTVIDCRHLWPPEFEGGCDCTECVSAEDHNSGVNTIQMAIDRVRAAGGKVCLGPGIFNLGATPVLINAARSVQIQGHGWGTIILYAGVGGAFQANGSIGLDISQLSILAITREAASGPLTVRNSFLVRVEKCLLLQTGGSSTNAAIGISGALMENVYRDNVLFGGVGIGAISRPLDATGLANQSSYTLTFGLRVEDNLIVARRFGVSLQGMVIHLGETRVAGNSIYGTSDAGVIATGIVAPQVFGNSRMEIAGNSVGTNGSGVVFATDNTRVADNDIAAFRPSPDIVVPRDGVAILTSRFKIVDGSMVINNRITGLSGAGVLIRGRLGTAIVKQNIIRGLGGGGIVMEEEATAEELSVDNNQIVDSGNLNIQGQRLSAIRVSRARQVAVAGNIIRAFAGGATQSAARWAIDVQSCASSRIAGNDILAVGPPTQFLNAGGGIFVQSPFSNAEIGNNTVRRAVSTPTAIDNSAWFGVRIGPSGPIPGAAGTLLFPFAVSIGNNQFAFVGPSVFAILPAGAETVGLHGNVIESFGSQSSVFISGVIGPASLQENRCFQTNGQNGPAIVIDVNAAAAQVSNNYAQRAPRSDIAAIRITTPNGPFTVLGNMASGPILVNNTGLGPPWAPLNVILP